MRTAHLIVSAAAFVVWATACVEYYLLADYGSTVAWYLGVPAALMPPFWCVYAWFASRRADPVTARLFTFLAVPVLLCGLFTAGAMASDVAQPRDVLEYRSWRPNVELSWPWSAWCGLVSFVWAVGLQVNRLRRPPDGP